MTSNVFKTALGFLILMGGTFLCMLMSFVLMPSAEHAERPKNLPVLKATKEGIVYDGYSSYKLYRVDMPDGSWHVVALPKK